MENNFLLAVVYPNQANVRNVNFGVGGLLPNAFANVCQNVGSPTCQHAHPPGSCVRRLYTQLLDPHVNETLDDFMFMKDAALGFN